MADATDKSAVRAPKAPKPGMPGGVAPSKLARKMEKLKNEYGVELVQATAVGGVDGLGQQMGSAASEEYPVRLYAPNPYDKVAAMKQRLLGDKPGVVTPFGQAVLTADDLRYLAKKEDEQTAANYKLFVSSLFNPHDPAQKALQEEIFPELTSEQEAEIDRRAELAKQIAKMRLHGRPRSKEDAMLLFALNSGALQLPAGNLWQPSTWGNVSDDLDASANQIQRGFFSPGQIWKKGVTSQNKVPFDSVWAARGGVGLDPTLEKTGANMPTSLPGGLRF